MITETERLVIRNFELKDKEKLFEIYSDKEAMQYRRSKAFENLEEVDEMLNRTFQKLELNEEFRYAVEHMVNKELVGTFLIKPFSEKECEIGYSIGKKYWGGGYGKELVNGMMKYIATQNYKTVIATSRKENIASLKLLESVGFIINPEKETTNCHLFEYFT
jgi:ribosomal-protein-alanine N-acetyltransferase